MGKNKTQTQMARLKHEQHWETAVSLIQALGGIEPVMQASVKRTQEVLHLLWNRPQKKAGLHKPKPRPYREKKMS